MLRLLLVGWFCVAAQLPASVEGRWELLSLDAENRGERLGTVVFGEKAATVVLADGTKVSLNYTLANGYLAGDSPGGRKVISVLRGRFDDRRDSLTMALVIRYLDSTGTNRSLKANGARLP
ncbi:MAG: hypothetical protein INH43_22740 [Acidobacteriaceae bacterium]|nr:hypothetical protein [Acidobacteriaceae bacterium]